MYAVTLLSLAAAVVVAQDGFYEKYGFTKTMAKCFGEGIYYDYLARIAIAQRNCLQLPVSNLYRLDFSIYSSNVGYPRHYGGESSYVPYPSHHPGYPQYQGVPHGYQQFQYRKKRQAQLEEEEEEKEVPTTQLPPEEEGEEDEYDDQTEEPFGLRLSQQVVVPQVPPVPQTQMPPVPKTQVPPVPQTQMPPVPKTQVPPVPQTQVPPVPKTPVPPVPQTQVPQVPPVPQSPLPQVPQQRQEPFFDKYYLLDSVNKITASLSNYSCTLHQLGIIDEYLNLNVDNLVNHYAALPINQHFKNNLVDGIYYCRDMSYCLPLHSQRSPLPLNLQRLLMAMECEKETRTNACFKEDLRRNIGDFDLSLFPSEDDPSAVLNKLAAIVTGVDSLNELEIDLNSSHHLTKDRSTRAMLWRYIVASVCGGDVASYKVSIVYKLCRAQRINNGNLWEATWRHRVAYVLLALAQTISKYGRRPGLDIEIMWRSVVLLLSTAAVIGTQEAFFEKYSFGKVMASCLGDEIYYGYLAEVVAVQQECQQYPVSSLHRIDYQTYSHFGFPTNIGGQPLYVPLPNHIHVGPSGQVAHPHSHIHVVQTRSAEKAALVTEEVPQQQQPKPLLQHQQQEEQQQPEPTFSRYYLLDSIQKITAALSNYTCTLYRLGVIDEYLNLNIRTAIERYRSMPISEGLKRDLTDGISYCNDLTYCIPIEKLRSPLPLNLQRLLTAMKCERETRTSACFKDDIRKNLDKFDQSIFGNESEDSKLNKLSAIVMGVDSINGLEIL
ncbi:uncharacterized protein LOC135217592 [Macrobrachium nipponense]|uniref:uncharacterized protein LOC135217592 n=1 Tax=Macrobrachium nipponense TaxID=159736 RepID=UPI0030C85718